MENICFDDLYCQYRNASLRSGKRPDLFKRMLESAKRFDDWAIIHRYGDSSYQYLAEEKMKATVFNEENSLDVQKNIVRLFEILTDENEREKILKSYISKYQTKDDYVFALVMTPTVAPYFPGMEYMTLREIDKTLSNKREQLQKMLED
jgi:hypothetical protein